MNLTDEEHLRPLTVNHRCSLDVNHRPADWFSIDTSLMQIEFTRVCRVICAITKEKKPDEDRQRADFCSLSLAALIFCF